MSTRWSLWLLFPLAVALGNPARAGDPPPPGSAGLSLSTALAPSFALGRGAERFAELVRERSAGRLRLTLHPGATLAQRDPAREFVALRDGAADLAVGSTLAWAAAVPQLELVALPWLVPTDAKLAALAADPLAAPLRAALIAAGVEPLAFAPLGHRALVLRRPALAAPSDLAGLRLRIPRSLPLADFYASFGSLPQTLGFAEAQAAFQAGALDGQDGTPAAIAATRLDALGMTQLVDWRAVAEIAVFAVNARVWQRWSPGERELVRLAAVDAAAVLAGLARAENDRAFAAMKQHGIAITRLTDEGRAAFAAAARSAYDKQAARAGAELVGITEAALARIAP